jgi:hypothetical protein
MPYKIIVDLSKSLLSFHKLELGSPYVDAHRVQASLEIFRDGQRKWR